jgi:16S rRNA (guanine1516-N2)-methyltransferase
MVEVVRLALTTALGATRALLAEARAAAERHGVPLLDRREQPLAELASREGAEALVVLGVREVALFVDGAERRYQPGMGALRAKRLALGEASTADHFLMAAALRPGDAVLDCTLGLGADALVAAQAVGPEGRVLGLEASPAIAAWVSEGLRRLPLPAARRVEVRCCEHGAFLRALADRGFDVVVFDPMFRHPRARAPVFDIVGRLADRRPLDPAALEQARRAAHRWVVVKDGVPGWDLARLGLTPLPSKRGAKRLYARVPAA